MTRLDPAQAEIATLLFSLPEANGYALAGGAALLAAGTIDRPTRDLDAFIAAKPTEPPGDVTTLAAALIETLEDSGWTVTIVRSHQTLNRLHVTRDDDSVEVDLAVDSPRLSPTDIARAFEQLDRLDDSELPTAEPAATRQLFALWADEIQSDRCV